MYDYIWLSENFNPERIVVPPTRTCPTNGHNLSDITEVSESTSISTVKSQSSLVQTVDSIMNASANRSISDDPHLTYVEVSFLSKLSDSSSIANSDEQAKTTPRRSFSIIRERFENSPKKFQNSSKSLIPDKENIQPTSSATKVETDHVVEVLSGRNSQSSDKHPKKQATLSSKSLIFSVPT